MTSPSENRSSRTPHDYEDLRQLGDAFARSASAFPNHLKWLTDHGYTREDTRQIRYIIESFYSAIATEAKHAPFEDALSPWPEYLAKIDADRATASQQYAEAARAIMDKALELPCVQAPVLSIDFCEDVLLICALRRMFIRAEIAARQDNIRCTAS